MRFPRPAARPRVWLRLRRLRDAGRARDAPAAAENPGLRDGTSLLPPGKRDCDHVDRLAPMRLYTLSKRHFVLVFVVFFLCFGLTVFVGIKGPRVIQQSAANFSLNNSRKLRQIQIRSNPLSTYNQQLWLTCVVELEPSEETSIQTSFSMTVKVNGVAQDGTTIYIHNKVHNRTRTLTCAGKCEEIIVAHLGYLNYTQYTVTVGFEHLNQPIREMNFTWKTYNPVFSQLEIWFRFVFVVLTFIVTCLFAHSLRKFSMRDWGIEQKWMSVLLPLLLLYNDPFFPLSFLVNSWFPGMLDDFFQSLFLCALLLFWLCVYHGIRVQRHRSVPDPVWSDGVHALCMNNGTDKTSRFNELHDPMYQYRVDTGNFQGMKVFFMVVATLYILYLLFLVVRACSELRHMPYVAPPAEFLSFYGLLNFYLYTLAFVYSPSKNALYESQLKDNPAFSMLNDSDDDVIYGSDYEEMPLQNGQAIRAKYKEESDSD
ncbi:Transmembrane protein 181 [Microtus ochrogaster]|uniref:Transmembrane protein 181 n=1 Tax=Microtus ochrogaster TaxID=79684 RepID=A0A8J6L4L6_MICOH|nr:Transmembrane protein 181 [Microtus ochrogaster]